MKYKGRYKRTEGPKWSPFITQNDVYKGIHTRPGMQGWCPTRVIPIKLEHTAVTLPTLRIPA